KVSSIIGSGYEAMGRKYDNRFKKHNNIQKHLIHEESGSALLESLPKGRLKLHRLLNNVTGTNKLVPWVIGKSACSRPFARINLNFNGASLHFDLYDDVSDELELDNIDELGI
ncbi:1793_t:CDS:2, partial [Gigaspora rosea]